MGGHHFELLNLRSPPPFKTPELGRSPTLIAADCWERGPRTVFRIVDAETHRLRHHPGFRQMLPGSCFASDAWWA